MRRIELALAVLLTAGCSDGGAPWTAPDTENTAGFELISAGEIVDAAFLSDLDDADRAAIREALQAARKEIVAILDRLRSGEIDREEARGLVQGVHARLIETLSQFLTEEQIERLFHPRPGHDRPDLDLTEEQLRLIHALREECRQAVARVKAAVEAGELSALEARRRVRRIAYECRREFCEILEPDQQAKVPFCRGPEDGAGDG